MYDGPGYNDDVIDIQKSCIKGLLRVTTWDVVTANQYVIYPSALAGKRSSRIISIEKDGDAKPNKCRTGNDDPVDHFRVVIEKGEKHQIYIAVAGEKVYTSDHDEHGTDWPLCKRGMSLFGPPPTKEDLKKISQQAASEKRRKKRRELREKEQEKRTH